MTGDKCQMTVGEWGFVSQEKGYGKCGKPAKFRVPNVEMRVEFVCGTHANSLNKMYERTGQTIRCEPIPEYSNGGE